MLPLAGVLTTSVRDCWWGHQQWQGEQNNTHNSRLTTHDSRLSSLVSRDTHDSQLTTHNSQLTTHNSQSPFSFFIFHFSFLTQHLKRRRHHTPILILQYQLMLPWLRIYFDLMKLLRLSEIMLDQGSNTQTLYRTDVLRKKLLLIFSCPIHREHKSSSPVWDR